MTCDALNDDLAHIRKVLIDELRFRVVNAYPDPGQSPFALEATGAAAVAANLRKIIRRLAYVLLSDDGLALTTRDEDAFNTDINAAEEMHLKHIEKYAEQSA